MNQKAVFTDLDGTLIETLSGRKFPLHSEDWKFIDNTLAALKHYVNKGYKICIVTNQGSIEQGYLTEKVFLRKINTVCAGIEKLLSLPANTVTYAYCTEMESYHRKPNPGMAYDMALELELDLKDCIMFGDTDSDKEFAVNSGMSRFMHITEIMDIEW